jgi:heme exporter protein B
MGNFAFTVIVGVVILPLMSVLYDQPLLDGRLLATALVGVFGFCTIGTLLATLTIQTRAREALLPIALLPVALPLLLTAVRATSGILRETDWQVWLQILSGICVIYFVLCWLLYGYVLEE